MQGTNPAPEWGPEATAGKAPHLPLSTLNFSCRPFRPSISDCWSARNFSSLFWTDLGSLFSSVRSRTCCNTAAMSVGPGAAATTANGAEMEERGEDQRDPEAWAAASASSLGGSRVLARRRLTRRDPGKSSPPLAAAQGAPERPRPRCARSRRKRCTLGNRVPRGGPLTLFAHSGFRLPFQASNASGKRSVFLNPSREPSSAPPIRLPPLSPPRCSVARPCDRCPRGGATEHSTHVPP